MTGKTASIAVLVAGTVAIGGYVLYSQREPAPAPAELIGRYCTDCHNANDFAGNLRLDDKDVEHVGIDAEIWERVVRKLRTGMMPPADAPRPVRALNSDRTR